MKDMVTAQGQTSMLLCIKIKYIFIPSVRTTNYGLKQLKFNGPRIWNALPTNIKNVTLKYNIPACFLEEI